MPLGAIAGAYVSSGRPGGNDQNEAQVFCIKVWLAAPITLVALCVFLRHLPIMHVLPRIRLRILHPCPWSRLVFVHFICTCCLCCICWSASSSNEQLAAGEVTYFVAAQQPVA